MELKASRSNSDPSAALLQPDPDNPGSSWSRNLPFDRDKPTRRNIRCAGPYPFLFDYSPCHHMQRHFVSLKHVLPQHTSYRAAIINHSAKSLSSAWVNKGTSRP